MLRKTWITPLDWRSLASYLGIAMGLMAPGLVPPLTVAAATGAGRMALRLVLVVLVSATVGAVAWRHRPPRLGTREALMVTGLAYPIWSAGGALAYWPDHPFLSALFEAASGITTTGLTALPHEGLSYAELFGRAWLQWIGGAGIAVLSVGVAGGVAAVTLYNSERGRSEIVGNVVRTARIVLAVYGVLSSVVCLALVATGVTLADAVLYTLAALSTGGFQPPGTDQLAGMPTLVLMIGMVLGATPLVLYRKPSAVVRDLQSRRLLAGLAIATVLIWLIERADLVHALFAVVTALTTTGFTIDDAAAWSPLLKSVAFALMLIGGAAGSTAGGIKLFRATVLFNLVRLGLFRQLVPPEATLPVRYGDRTLNDAQVTGILVFLGTYGIALLVGWLVLTASGLTFEDAAFGSASALGTVGLWIGPDIDTLPVPAQGVLILQMWAGRVELLPLLLVLYPPAWRQRRKANHTMGAKQS